MPKTKIHCKTCGKPSISEYELKRFKTVPTKWFTGLEKWELKVFYQGLLNDIREVARKAGYGVGVHGSMQRDLDLIAVPWVDKYVGYEELAKRIHKVVCGAIYKEYSWSHKPHGRYGTSMFIGSTAYIDLSVISLKEIKK